MYSSTRGGERPTNSTAHIGHCRGKEAQADSLWGRVNDGCICIYMVIGTLYLERERESGWMGAAEWTQRIKQIRYPNTRIIVFRKRKFGLARKDLDMHTNVSSQKLAMILGSGCPTWAMMSSLPPNTWRIHMRIYTVMPKSETTLILNLLCVFIMVWVYWIEYCSCSSNKIKTRSGQDTK